MIISRRAGQKKFLLIRGKKIPLIGKLSNRSYRHLLLAGIPFSCCV